MFFCTEIDWLWGSDQEKAFNNLKDLVCSAQCMAMYDATLPRILAAGASLFGLGIVGTVVWEPC